MTDNNFAGEYKTEFKVHKTGAVSIGNVRYGPSTHVARCLSGRARELNLLDKEKESKSHPDPLHYGNIIDTEILLEARDKVMDGWQVADAVAFVKDKYKLSKPRIKIVEESLQKNPYGFVGI